MTRPGIEPMFPGPLTNTLPTWPMSRYIYLFFFLFSFLSFFLLSFSTFKLSLCIFLAVSPPFFVHYIPPTFFSLASQSSSSSSSSFALASVFLTLDISHNTPHRPHAHAHIHCHQQTPGCPKCTLSGFRLVYQGKEASSFNVKCSRKNLLHGRF